MEKRDERRYSMYGQSLNAKNLEHEQKVRSTLL